MRVHGGLVLGGVADETLVLREGDIRGGSSVTLVVGDDFDTVVLPDTDTSAKKDNREYICASDKVGRVTYE